MGKERDSIITLQLAKTGDLAKIKTDMQAAFIAGAAAFFGPDLKGPIPSNQEIEESFQAENTVIYRILSDGKPVGGVVLRIDEKKQHNALELFYINVEEHGRGIGLKAWQSVEKQYPKTKVWETFTPCFEKRNIHFYVNKCGFQIVEYFNKHHVDTVRPIQPESGEEDFFRFEKNMEK